ncbi:DUF4177 domain-containing protein [Haloferula sp. A504]|uniref:DUF4177 domain-containing protein n=1 Tax=Haloferula sp. A504 TaxID=3373601 RepID=UPI0031C3FE55|nr:DUF4177 domain-containing protein [Verrucomicrobiaceae bacterium E54]
MAWEYKVVKVPIPGVFKPEVKAEAVEQVLNHYGADGWELVSAIGVHTGNGATIEIVSMLKRPRAAAPAPPAPPAEGPPPLP